MSYTGMNNTTGQALSDLAHIWQSFRDIVTTPIGSRLMRRDYGSLVPMLIDQPLNGVTRLRVMSAAVTALVRWEPRVRVSAVALDVGTDGSLAAIIDADRVDGPRRESLGTLTVPLREGSA
ncbi:GPW/gp25 family protein [Cupriavidus sp. 2MCAB6]|uniref:GPW/gp25 family protein n=1 Tax=Cupriavidus sp. 2MCAB6 TaxID=3232981 RepID=UPI003F8F3C4A